MEEMLEDKTASLRLYLPLEKLMARHNRFYQIRLYDGEHSKEHHYYLRKLLALGSILWPSGNERLSLARYSKREKPRKALFEEGLLEMGFSTQHANKVVVELLEKYDKDLVKNCQARIARYERHRAVCLCGSLETCTRSVTKEGGNAVGKENETPKANKRQDYFGA